jgi:predicted permease
MPDFKQEVRDRLARLNLEPVRETAIVEEVAQHLEDRYQELLALGMTGPEAGQEVLKELDRGGLLTRGLRRVERRAPPDTATPGGPAYVTFPANLWKDVRYAARSLRANPGFAIVAILSLALGIGANTSIFQLLDAVRLRTLPVKNPDELVEIGIGNMKGRHGHMTGDHEEFSNPLWEQIRDHQQAFSGAFAWNSGLVFNLAAGGERRPARGMFVSGDAFNVLGVSPVLGRVFTAADDQHGCGFPAAVISYSFWQQEFGGNVSALGSKLRLEGHPAEIIGVTPAGFFGMEVGRSFDVAVPLCAEPLILGEGSVFARRDGWWLAAVGRLKPGWSTAKATAELESISPGIFADTLPASYDAARTKEYLAAKLSISPAGSGLSNLRERYEDPLWILLALAGMVLLIACANLANLMMARTGAREREIAVRLALGASRSRLIQQLLVESLLLSTGGAAAGSLLAQALTRVLISFLSTQSSQVFLNLSLDWRVLGFTAGLAILTCVLFGLAPALRASGTPPAAAMKAGSRGGPARGLGLRRALVVTQVALSLTLLAGALLFVRTFQNLLTLDAGFQQGGLLAAHIDIAPLHLPLANRTGFKKELLDRVREIPGVESAAEVSIVPATSDWWNDTVHTNASGQEVRQSAFFNLVGPGFFKTMGTRLVQGRDVSDSDSLNSPAVAVVDETFVRRFLPGTDPLGKTFRVDDGPDKPQPMYQIVGVVKDTKYRTLREAPVSIVYLPATQAKDPDMQPALLIRSNLPLDTLRTPLDRTMRAANPAIAFHFTVLQTEIRDTLVRERLMASLSGFFGLLAALLAAIGLYGVVSYMVVRRHSEIGIRMALGADRGRVLGLILREAAVLLVLGLGIGMGLALLASKALGTLLFGLSARDPGTLALAAGSLAAVALAASYLPAHRAARLDPLEALRDE